jgi:phosphoribosyl 1,2-cyclic phosphodiesterase
MWDAEGVVAGVPGRGSVAVIRFSLLGSGSNGNATLVASPSCKILIDNGLSFKRLAERASAIGETLDDLEAVFVTHEHSDHTNGLGVLARRLGVPVYMTRGTRENLPRAVGALPDVRLLDAGTELRLDGLVVNSFSISHDAADPVSYVVRCAGAKLGFAGDLGHASQLVQARLRDSHALVLESNYCPEMLRRGSYPAAIQQRIRGRQGHLSNEAAGALLSSMVHPALRLVVLVHISEENNTAERAYATAQDALGGHPAELHVAERNTPPRLFEVRP